MRKQLKIVTVIATVLLLTCLSVVPVAAQPAVCRFAGTATLDENPGTTVTAELEDGTVVGGPVDVDPADSSYYMLIPQVGGVPAEGATLNFYVDGFLGGTDTWNAGGIKTLDLVAVTGVQYTLDVNINPEGGGTVTGDGINCPADCTQDYAEGTVVELTAAANDGFEFVNWTDDAAGTALTVEVTMDEGYSITANFTIPSERVELEFRGSLAKGERETLLTPDIPGGATELEITLDATADIDLELYDSTTFVIGWRAIISSPGSTTRTYQGDTFAYSGWAGGDEYITADGPLSRAYTLKVYGYEAGDYVVTVSYMPGPPDETPPEITITAPDGTVGAPTTIEVSATDLSGVSMIWFGVYAEEYPEEWGEGSPVVMICTFDDEGSVTFTSGWAATYIVEAIAVDNSEAHNMTPEDAPETATFEVLE